MKRRRYLKTTVILMVICLLAGGIAYLKWDDSKSSWEIIDMEKSFLQSESVNLLLYENLSMDNVMESTFFTPH